MQKFFVNQEQIGKENIKIIGEDVNHILNVLRLEIGETILIGNKQNGNTYLAEISKKNKDVVIANIIKEERETTEPSTYIHVFQGLPKSDKMELIIQKGTEIGVSEFTPVEMNRCIVKLDDKENLKKNQRWQKIAQSAAEQSKRDIIPTVNFAKNFKNIFEIFQEYDIVLVAYENEHIKTLKDELKKCTNARKKVAIIIGPEGGLDKEEVNEIIKHGGKCVSLGKRILRTETAPIVMSTIILYEFNDMN